MADPDSEYPKTRLSLIVQLKNDDDHEAWEQFVKIYRPIIYRMARKRGLQDADALDLVQQVLLSVSQAIGRWEKKNESVRFRHWLRRVAKNAILNALTRKPKDKAAGGSSVKNALENEAESADRLDEEIAIEQKREIFFNAATVLKNEISEDAQQIFQLAIVEGLSPQTVAQKTNKSIGATYAARARLMARIRQLARELEEQER